MSLKVKRGLERKYKMNKNKFWGLWNRTTASRLPGVYFEDCAKHLAQRLRYSPVNGN